MRMCATCILIAILVRPALAAEEEEPMERNSLVYDHFQKAADKVEPKLAWKATTPAEHEAWRSQFKPKFLELLGRNPEAVPQEVEWTEKLETDLFTRHKIYIRSEADYWVPAFYFVPKKRQEKAPAIICLHGHSGIMPYIGEGTEKEKEKSKKHALDYAVYFAEHGYITIAVVQRGWNETSHEKPHSCHRVTMDSFLLGMTPVGLRTWDAMRVLDFLETREEVDATRIGAAGLSGGGTSTLFFAARDERVKLAMVAGYFCTFRDSIFTIHHCICNCVPGIMEWGEMSDVGALIAPRPALMISGDKDNIFPIDATKRAYAQLGKTYAVLGAKENLDSDFFEGVHEWSNRKTLSFLEKHLGVQ
jgi:dienelactone hydrolase